MKTRYAKLGRFLSLTLLLLLPALPTWAMPRDVGRPQAPPQTPHNFWGTVRYEEGAYVPVGSDVIVIYNAMEVATTQTYESQGAIYYTVDVPVDDAGHQGVPPGETVNFIVEDRWAIETATIVAGASIQLDLTVPGGSGPIVVVLPESVSVGTGNTVDVNVNVGDVVDLYAFDFTLAYNDRVDGVSVTPGLAWQNGSVVVEDIDNTNRQIHYSVTLLGSGNLDGDINLATITFEGAQAGTAPLTFTDSLLLDPYSQELTHTVRGGEIVVSGDLMQIHGTCLLQPTLVRGDHADCTVIAAGQSTTSDYTGYFELHVPAGTNYTAMASAAGYLSATISFGDVPGATIDLGAVELRAGDVNDDGVVDILDISAMGGCYTQGATCLPQADFDRDGFIHLADMVAGAGNYLETEPQPWDTVTPRP